MQRRNGNSTVDKFWSRVDKSSGHGPNGDCWIWTGAKRKAGYGYIFYNGRMTTASRIAYEITYGPLPNDHYACHTCDYPPCVKPDHLFDGTPAENQKDSKNKGRQRKATGENSGTAKLTSADAVEIRRRKLAGETNRNLANSYAVSERAIHNIAHGESWIDAGNLIDKEALRRVARKNLSKSNHKYGFRGIAPSKKRWKAIIRDKDSRRQIYIGLYLTPEEAARAYDMKAIELYGSEALLNFPT